MFGLEFGAVRIASGALRMRPLPYVKRCPLTLKGVSQSSIMMLDKPISTQHEQCFQFYRAQFLVFF
jgi:hypothetical protein